MKKVVSAFLMAALLCCCTAAAAFAAGPATPVINGQMPDCYMNLGGTGVTLFTDASVSDGGTLRYQWYVSNVENISTIRAIDGAEGDSYQVPEIPGVMWYCYAAWNVSGGLKSGPVYSRLIRVEFYEEAGTHTHAFGQWMVTTEATCTEPGIQARECDCGHTERAEIPAAGHQWDEGRITREPTTAAQGETTFTCAVCRATKTEMIPALREEAADPPAPPAPEVSDHSPSAAFPWWAIALIAVLLIGGIAAGVVVFRRKKKQPRS